MSPAFLCLFALFFGQAKPPVTALAFCPGGKQILAGSQEGLRLLTWPELNETARPDSRLAHIHALGFSPDQTTLLVAGGRPGEAGEVEIFAWPKLKTLGRVQAHADLVYGVGWSPDGSHFVTGSADNTCTVFRWKSENAPERVVTYLGHSRPVVAVSFLPEGNLIASASIDQTIQLWDAQTARQLRSLDNHLRPICDLAIRPSGTGKPTPVMAASTGEDKTIRLWQPTLGRLVRFSRLDTIPRVGTWSPTGDRLVAGCEDGRVVWLDPDDSALEPKRVWDSKVGKIHTLDIHPATGQVLVGGEKGLGVGPNP